MVHPFPFAAAALGALLLAVPPARAGYAEGVAAFGQGRHDLAAREFLAAAQAGDAESAYMLGRLYAMGSGVPQDWVQAWVWHDRAARRGSPQAQAARENMEAIMTPQQLAAARAQAGPASTPVAVRPPAVQPYDTGAYTPVTPPPPPAPPPQALPPPAGQGGHEVVLIPRESVVATVPAPSREPAAEAVEPVRMVANGPSYEGLLRASGGLADQIRLVQRRLNREGYFAGPVDGIVGPLTRQALRNYQRDQGLPPTGRLSAALIDRLAAMPPTAIVRVQAVPPEAQQAAR